MDAQNTLEQDFFSTDLAEKKGWMRVTHNSVVYTAEYSVFYQECTLKLYTYNFLIVIFKSLGNFLFASSLSVYSHGIFFFSYCTATVNVLKL